MSAAVETQCLRLGDYVTTPRWQTWHEFMKPLAFVNPGPETQDSLLSALPSPLSIFRSQLLSATVRALLP